MGAGEWCTVRWKLKNGVLLDGSWEWCTVRWKLGNGMYIKKKEEKIPAPREWFFVRLNLKSSGKQFLGKFHSLVCHLLPKLTVLVTPPL